MKHFRLESCNMCPDHVVGHCWHFETEMEREFTEEDEKEIMEKRFPDWCPLKDVKEGDDVK